MILGERRGGGIAWMGYAARVEKDGQVAGTVQGSDARVPTPVVTERKERMVGCSRTVGCGGCGTRSSHVK